MKKTFYDKTDIGASRKLIDDASEINIKEGTVISVATSEVRVQIEGNRFQPAFAAKGITVEQNDRVLLVRSPRTNRWVVIGAYVNPQSAGNVNGSKPVNALAPSGLTIIPLSGGFLARCTVGVDTPVAFEFEVADDTAETGAVNLLIAGSVLPYVATTVKQVRVRSVDNKWNRSGWTNWATATPSGSGHIIQDNGSSVTSRTKLNLIGFGVTDNSGADSTDVRLSSTIVFSVEGALAVSSKPLRIPNIFGVTRTVKKVYLAVNTAPTGAAIIVDILKNGSTIFTTSGHRPQISISALSGFSTTIDVPSWADGDYFQLSVAQVGSTITGSDLTVTILVQ